MASSPLFGKLAHSEGLKLAKQVGGSDNVDGCGHAATSNKYTVQDEV